MEIIKDTPASQVEKILREAAIGASGKHAALIATVDEKGQIKIVFYAED